MSAQPKSTTGAFIRSLLRSGAPPPDIYAALRELGYTNARSMQARVSQERRRMGLPAAWTGPHAHSLPIAAHVRRYFLAAADQYATTPVGLMCETLTKICDDDLIAAVVDRKPARPQ